MKKIDTKLRRLMSERGMTQAELCRLTGIPTWEINKEDEQ